MPPPKRRLSGPCSLAPGGRRGLASVWFALPGGCVFLFCWEAMGLGSCISTWILSQTKAWESPSSTGNGTRFVNARPSGRVAPAFNWVKAFFHIGNRAAERPAANWVEPSRRPVGGKPRKEIPAVIRGGHLVKPFLLDSPDAQFRRPLKYF